VAIVVSLAALCITGAQAYIASDSEKRQLRAYITVSELQVTPINGQPLYSFVPEIKNTGQTPALDVTITNIRPSYELALHSGGAYDQWQMIDWKVGAPQDPGAIRSDVVDLTNIPPINIGAGSSITASTMEDRLDLNAGVEAQSNKIGRFFYGVIREPLNKLSVQ
jgi:hypothetical protein